MPFAWEHVRTVGSVLSILGVGAGLAIYFTDFKSRLERLENQVQLIAVAPAVVQKGGNLYTNEAKPNDFEAYSEPVTNPLLATCRDLYKRVATAVESKDSKVQSSLNGYMRELGCAEAIRGKPVSQQ